MKKYLLLFSLLITLIFCTACGSSISQYDIDAMKNFQNELVYPETLTIHGNIIVEKHNNEELKAYAFSYSYGGYETVNNIAIWVNSNNEIIYSAEVDYDIITSDYEDYKIDSSDVADGVTYEEISGKSIAKKLNAQFAEN